MIKTKNSRQQKAFIMRKLFEIKNKSVGRNEMKITQNRLVKEDYEFDFLISAISEIKEHTEELGRVSMAVKVRRMDSVKTLLIIPI